MTSSASGLSDVLRQMADNTTDHLEATAAATGPSAEELPAAEDMAEAYDSGEIDGSASVARPRRPVRTAASANQPLKAAAVPVLFTVGALLLVPAVWAVLLLGGANVWHAQRPDAQRMAVVMLACWPIALSLFGAGVFFGLQVRREKKLRDNNRCS